MTTTDQPRELVRAHQSSDQIGWDAWQAQSRIAHAAWQAEEEERRKGLTLMDPAERARLNALGANLDEYGEVMEPQGCMAGGFVRVDPKVVAEDQAEKAKRVILGGITPGKTPVSLLDDWQSDCQSAQKKRHRTYSDGGYRISKRSPEAARTELVVTSALRYAEDLKKKEEFEKLTLGMEGSRLQLERDLAKQPPMPTRGRGRRVRFR